jgi:endonuclease-8
MPEGDTVAGHAERLRPLLVERVITEVAGTAPPVRANSHRILGATVLAVRTAGKNLIVDLDTGYSIRVHLGMPGRWRFSSAGAPQHGSARLILGTEVGEAACFSAPTVEVDRTPAVDSRLARLGPDVLAEFDEEEFVRRARARESNIVAELLVDQRVLAGIGNVYKSELLFLQRIHPSTPIEAISDRELRELSARARKLLAANVGPISRSTTGSRARGAEIWVYGRSGRPCRRCGHVIAESMHGQRVTFWCPACQPLEPRGPGSGPGSEPSDAAPNRGR